MATLTTDLAAERGDEAALVDEHRCDHVAPSSTTGSTGSSTGCAAAGLTTGDTIAVVVGNRREWFEIAMACAHGGWTYVPVNWHWVADELAYVFDDADVVGVIVDGRYADAVAAALADDRRAAGVRRRRRHRRLRRARRRTGPSSPTRTLLAGASTAESPPTSASAGRCSTRRARPAGRRACAARCSATPT